MGSVASENPHFKELKRVSRSFLKYFEGLQRSTFPSINLLKNYFHAIFVGFYQHGRVWVCRDIKRNGSWVGVGGSVSGSSTPAPARSGWRCLGGERRLRSLRGPLVPGQRPRSQMRRGGGALALRHPLTSLGGLIKQGPGRRSEPEGHSLPLEPEPALAFRGKPGPSQSLRASPPAAPQLPSRPGGPP